MIYDEATVSKLKSDTTISINPFMLGYKWFVFRFLGPGSYLLGLAVLSDSSKLIERVR